MLMNKASTQIFRKTIALIITILFTPSLYPLWWCDHDYITPFKFKHLSNFVIEQEGKVNFKFSDVLEGDIVFVKTDLLNYFFTNVFPHLPAIILITHDSYAPSPGTFANYLNGPKIIHWFGAHGDIVSHPKFTNVPFGIAHDTWNQDDKKMLDRVSNVFDKGSQLFQDTKAYANFSPEAKNANAPLLEKFSHQPFIVNKPSPTLQEYLREMAQHRYTICPSGKGLDNHRTWEALLVGSIPVVKSSTLDPLYKGLPIITVNSWNDVTPENLEATYQQVQYLKQKNRQKLFFHYWKDLIFSKCKPSKRHYVCGDNFRNLADFIIDRNRQQPPNPATVAPGSIFFVEAGFLPFFFSKYFHTLTNPIILITQNSDFPAPGKFASYLDDPKLIRWFGQNCDLNQIHHKFTPIPIGIANQQWKNGKPQIYDNLLDLLEKSKKDQPRKNQLYINWNKSHESRAMLEKHFEHNKLAYIASKKPFKDYLKEMSEYRYVLSPHGAGLDCFRTWEALLIGCIPVVKTSTLDPLYKDLPVIIVKDWFDINESYLNKEYEQLKNKPFKKEKLFMDYWENMILASKTFEQNASLVAKNNNAKASTSTLFDLMDTYVLSPIFNVVAKTMNTIKIDYLR